MIKKLLLITVVFIVSEIQNSFAQCFMYEISLSKRIQQSILTIEGQVVSRKSFWNNQHNFIYNSNTVEIFKTFKGK